MHSKLEFHQNERTETEPTQNKRAKGMLKTWMNVSIQHYFSH